ncbi:MAG: hypothetical protein H6R07_1512 [Proteobacteria bacterium]|nr:hypothetical protein [Pseudomonadota bacterium]
MFYGRLDELNGDELVYNSFNLSSEAEMHSMLRWRLGHFILSLFCAATIGFALYLQNTEFLSPCPLCIFQRVGFIVTGFLALLAALFPLQRLNWFWPMLITVSAGAGAAVSLRHVQIQYFLDPKQLASCGPGLDYLLQTQPWLQVFRDVLSGHGECAVIDWSLFGLSLPVLALGGFTLLITGTWLTRRWELKK